MTLALVLVTAFAAGWAAVAAGQRWRGRREDPLAGLAALGRITGRTGPAP